MPASVFLFSQNRPIRTTHKKMIRLFTALCKAMLKIIVDADIYQAAVDSFSHYGKPCPKCGAYGKLSPHGNYGRGLVSHENGKVSFRRIRPLRFICRCGATHALLPDILVPYSPYSLSFKLTVLIAYYERDTAVAAVCGQFEIAVSTLYEWKKLLAEYKELLLGVFLSQKNPALSFLRGLLEYGCLSDTLRGFFGRFAFSFMQRRPGQTSRRHPP